MSFTIDNGYFAIGPGSASTHHTKWWYDVSIFNEKGEKVGVSEPIYALSYQSKGFFCIVWNWNKIKNKMKK